MSVQMTGWFVVTNDNPKILDAVGYRCEKCGIEYRFDGETEPKAYCCNQWLTKPKESWFNKLPRVKAEPARRALVLPGNKIDFGAEEETVPWI